MNRRVMFVLALGVMAGAGAAMAQTKAAQPLNIVVYGGSGAAGGRIATEAAGRSAISMEDFAVAIVDEIEKPQYLNKRFTVGY